MTSAAPHLHPPHPNDELSESDRRLLAELGLTDAELVTTVRSRQATIRRVRASAPSGRIEVALKQFLRFDQHTTAVVEQEAQATHKASRALRASRLKVRVPEILAVEPDTLTYVASWEPGQRLDEIAREVVGTPRETQIARQLVEVLPVVYDATGDRFGDLHSANVLIDGDSLVLLDLTAVLQPQTAAPSRALADLGYWNSIGARRALGHLKRCTPSAARAEVRLARTLANAALDAGLVAPADLDMLTELSLVRTWTVRPGRRLRLERPLVDAIARRMVPRGARP